MKSIVTGGLGLIGSEITRQLLDAGDSVIVVDDLSYGKEEYLPKGAAFLKLNARRLADCAPPCDRLFHFGSHSSILHSFKDPINTAEDTILGMKGVLDYAAKFNPRLVCASSATVYGTAPLPHYEGGPMCPANEYAVAKLLCEKMASNSDAALLRIFTGYGPQEYRKDWYKSPVGMFIDDALNGRPFEVYGDGRQTRDFVHVEDIAKAAVKVSETEFEGPLNIGTGVETSLTELARMVAEASGVEFRMFQGQKFPGYVDRMRAEASLFKEYIGTPMRTVKEGIEEMLHALVLTK